jgi:ADP-ribose pyrophosphatase
MKPEAAAPDPLAEETLESRLVYTGQFLRVYEDTVRCPDGHVAPREYLRHPGAVMVVPVLDDGRLVLERQYRYPLRRSFDRVSGRQDRSRRGHPHLRPARAARGDRLHVAAEWTYLGGFHNAIGYCDEKIEVYLARGLRLRGHRH